MTISIEGLTHWSIPVNDLSESEAFYRDILGLEYRGRLGDSGMACFTVGDTSLLLCQRNEPIVRTVKQDNFLHHSFTVSPETLTAACRYFKETGVPVVSLVYREQGFFIGRELYFQDPSGNVLELRDPTWVKGMAKPSFDELAS